MKVHAKELRSLRTQTKKAWTRQSLSMRLTTVAGQSSVFQPETNLRARARERMETRVKARMAKAKKAKKERRLQSLLPKAQVPWSNPLGSSRLLLTQMKNKTMIAVLAPGTSCSVVSTCCAIAQCCSVLMLVV